MCCSDWTDADPESIYRNLKAQSDYYNYSRNHTACVHLGGKEKGLGATTSERVAWARMNMSPNDIADVSGATYISDERQCSECELDWTVPAGRTGEATFYQWIGDDVL